MESSSLIIFVITKSNQYAFMFSSPKFDMKMSVNWFDWKDNVEKKIIELIHKEKSGTYR